MSRDVILIKIESTASTEMSRNIHWPDHIPDRSLQNMVAEFLSGNLKGQKFYQYCICIYMRATFHTYNLPRLYKDPAMHEQFLKSKKLYTASALCALQNLNLLNSPSLSLIQALISAVSFMNLTTSVSLFDAFP